MKDSTKKGIAAATAATAILAGAAVLSPGQYKQIEEIEQDQEEVFVEKGSYEQLKPNGRLPGKAKLPDGAQVHVYDGPRGKGYEVHVEDENAIYIVGYGPEAEERTKTIQKVSSTTPPSL